MITGMRNETDECAGNCPEANCTVRTLEFAAIDAVAAGAPEIADKNSTVELADKAQPVPDNVISNLPVEGIETSGNNEIVIETCFWDARTLDREIAGEPGPRFGTTATRLPTELEPIVSPFSLRVAALTADENACGAEGFVTPVKVIENESPPYNVPVRMEIVKIEPPIDAAPLLSGLPRGEKNTGVPALQLNEPGSVMTILPLAGTGFAGTMEMVIEIPSPPRAGLDSVMVGIEGPRESVRTSHTST